MLPEHDTLTVNINEDQRNLTKGGITCLYWPGGSMKTDGLVSWLVFNSWNLIGEINNPI